MRRFWLTIWCGNGSPKIPTVEKKMASLDPNEAIAALRVSSRHALFQAVVRTDLYSFVQWGFPIVSGGKRLQPNWHLEAMAYALTDVINGNTRRLIITVPPR